MPEWLVEPGIGETRAVLVDDGGIVEGRIELDGTVPAGTIVRARVTSVGTGGRNAVGLDDGGVEYLLPSGAPGVTEGAAVTIEVTREPIPGAEAWKRPLARISDKAPEVAKRLVGQPLPFPAPIDRLAELGWDEVIDEARSSIVRFYGGELRISPTPAMTLIDVDGHLPPEELAVVGARQAARAVRRLDIGGSIGIDLPTSGSKSARQHAAAVIDSVLPQPFERTAVNGFGFVQIVRPRLRPSLVELAQDRVGFEARALLRRVAFETPGPKRLVAHPALIKLLENRDSWMSELARQIGGAVELRADPSVPMSGGYAEKA
ncbi:MAG: ribonuclease [Sphingomonas sp.]|nr:ribonuclease [Sphingomonas sp.]